MIEKVVRMTLLLDTYGSLVTDRQREFFSLHYDHDLSLAEIAEQYGVSRQGVHDIIQRTEKSFETFEAKLGVLAKRQKLWVELERILEELRRISDNVPQEAREALEKVERNIEDILLEQRGDSIVI